MSPNRKIIVQTVPQDYQEVYYLSVTDAAKMLVLNVLAFALLALFIVLVIVWAAVVVQIRGPYTMTDTLPWFIWMIGVLAVFPLHEWIHGLAISYYGHKPRYGAKYVNIGPVKIPVILFATADDALFWRDHFIVIALAPVIVITLVGMGLMVLLPDSGTVYIAMAIVFNGSGAVGDLWMTWVALRYAPDSLVRDEADSIRIYARQTTPEAA